MLNDTMSYFDVIEPTARQFPERKFVGTKVIESFPSHRLKRMS
jgi:hypothetical protein